MSDPLVVSPTLTVPAGELWFTSVRASGPGGQNVNKVSSKIDLRFDFEHSKVLDAATKTRLRTLARGRMDAEGHIMIVSQATRDRLKNLEDARQKLAELIAKACFRPKRRRPTRPSRGATESRLSQKKHHSAQKKSRSARGDSE
jgi:ribosome-associated protein